MGWGAADGDHGAEGACVCEGGRAVHFSVIILEILNSCHGQLDVPKFYRKLRVVGIIIIIIIKGLSLLQSIPPTTANKQLKHKSKGGAGLESC